MSSPRLYILGPFTSVFIILYIPLQLRSQGLDLRIFFDKSEYYEREVIAPMVSLVNNTNTTPNAYGFVVTYNITQG